MMWLNGSLSNFHHNGFPAAGQRDNRCINLEFRHIVHYRDNPCTPAPGELHLTGRIDVLLQDCREGIGCCGVVPVCHLFRHPGFPIPAASVLNQHLLPSGSPRSGSITAFPAQKFWLAAWLLFQFVLMIHHQNRLPKSLILLLSSSGHPTGLPNHLRTTCLPMSPNVRQPDRDAARQSAHLHFLRGQTGHRLACLPLQGHKLIALQSRA